MNHAVYPRVCGGTRRQILLERCGRSTGLSPRVRGNQCWAVRSAGRNACRSIPACAGEHSAGLSRNPSPQASGVYPRVCGGTKTSPWTAQRGPAYGSIPACAGEPGAGRSMLFCAGLGSIPACAGEPIGGARVLIPLSRAVYPRVCGGTSPPQQARDRIHTHGTVYPRVCGGTLVKG